MALQRVSKVNKADKASFWSAQIKNWQSGTISQAVYCKENNLSFARFGYWRTKLLTKERKSSEKNFISLKSNAPSANSVQVSMRVKSPVGLMVEIMSCAPQEQVSFVLSALRITNDST